MIPRTTRLMSWDGRLPQVGEFLRTRAGTTYAIVGVHLNTRPNPKSIGRYDLIKFDHGEALELVPAAAVIHPFQWCPRGQAGPR